MDHDDVYILYHLHSGDSGDQSVKLIGVYRSEASAVLAVNRLKKLPGFTDFPEIIDHRSDDSAGFNINRYRLNDDANWLAGFDPTED